MLLASDADNPLKDLTALTGEVAADVKYEGLKGVDGATCYVHSFLDQSDEGKIWVWKDQGFRLKVEARTKDGTQNVEFKNVEVGNGLDRRFEPSTDIQMMDMSES